MGKEEKELVAEVVEAVIETHGKIKSMKGKKTVEVMEIIADILPDILKKVEELGDKLGSADKKELAIEACLKYCNIKYVPDSLERQLIGFMIDGSIAMLNKWFGKDWLDKIAKTTSFAWKWLKKLFGRK
jgi:hypothetical protein